MFDLQKYDYYLILRMSNMDTCPYWTWGGAVFRDVFLFWDNE